jgi:hypothetical protein
MTQPHDPARRGSSGTVVLGAILIALGLVFFAGQQLNVDLADAAWPFYVIAPGLALMAFGLTQARGSGLTIAGSMATMIGLVLLYQNATDHWESWAYAWALVAPGGSGIGMLLYGTRSGDARMARDGFFTILTAIGLFAAGLVFFEGIIGISGDRLPLPQWALPAAIIVIGLLLLLRGFTARRTVLEPSQPVTAEAAPAEAEPSDSPEEPQAPPAT